jgi:hypothetical protein
MIDDPHCINTRHVPSVAERLEDLLAREIYNHINFDGGDWDMLYYFHTKPLGLFPDFDTEEIEAIRERLHKLGLVERFSVHGDRYTIVNRLGMSVLDIPRKWRTGESND